ncbi:hypothetical protein BGZ76_010135 [Entomortierella beljakovae]|nr:hypothetical protein BGZ76_010135 [Entomortierella beljakovae]
MVEDCNQGENLRTSYWNDLQAAEKEAERLEQHMSNMEADVLLQHNFQCKEQVKAAQANKRSKYDYQFEDIKDCDSISTGEGLDLDEAPSPTAWVATISVDTPNIIGGIFSEKNLLLDEDQRFSTVDSGRVEALFDLI